jgi:hypothetical protein
MLSMRLQHSMRMRRPNEGSQRSGKGWPFEHMRCVNGTGIKGERNGDVETSDWKKCLIRKSRSYLYKCAE